MHFVPCHSITNEMSMPFSEEFTTCRKSHLTKFVNFAISLLASEKCVTMEIFRFMICGFVFFVIYIGKSCFRFFALREERFSSSFVLLLVAPSRFSKTLSRVFTCYWAKRKTFLRVIWAVRPLFARYTLLSNVNDKCQQKRRKALKFRTFSDKLSFINDFRCLGNFRSSSVLYFSRIIDFLSCKA